MHYTGGMEKVNLKKGQNKHKHLIFMFTIYLCIKKFKTLKNGPYLPWPFLLKRKKNGQIMKLISNMWPILYYTVELVIPNICTKFYNTKSSSC